MQRHILINVSVMAFLAGCASVAFADEEKSEPNLEGKTVRQWLVLWDSGNSEERRDAHDALGRFCFRHEEAFAVVARALQDTDEDVRRAAAKYLSSHKQNAADAIPALLRALKEDKSDLVRRNAVEALGSIGPEDATVMKALVRSLKNDPDSGVRIRVAFVFRHLKQDAQELIPALTDALKDKSSSVRVQAAHALAAIGEAETTIPLLFAAMKGKESDPAGIAMALSQFGLAAIPAIRKEFKNDDESIRGGAVKALGYVAQHAEKTRQVAQVANPEVIALLKDKEPFVRRCAAETLALLDCTDEATIQAFKEALDDNDAAVQIRAIIGLHRIGVEMADAIPAIKKLLKDPSPVVRAQAIAGLRGAKSEIRSLIAMLKDKEAQVRYTAAYCLGDFQAEAKEAIPGLLAAMKDSDDQVRKAAKLSLSKIDPETYPYKQDE
jgi:HEAT repeat protein